MKRKRTVIFTITSLYVKKVKENGQEVGERHYYDRNRLVGWYSDLAKAQKCVEEDWADFDENWYYNYIVIEKNTEGLYNMSNDLGKQYEWWYRFDYKQEKWIACEKPQWSVGTINWGLG
jgi:hypothetical protein